MSRKSLTSSEVKFRYPADLYPSLTQLQPSDKSAIVTIPVWIEISIGSSSNAGTAKPLPNTIFLKTSLPALFFQFTCAYHLSTKSKQSNLSGAKMHRYLALFTAFFHTYLQPTYPSHHPNHRLLLIPELLQACVQI